MSEHPHRDQPQPPSTEGEKILKVEEVSVEDALLWGDEQAKLDRDAVGMLANRPVTSALVVRNSEGVMLGAVTMSPGRVIGLYVTPQERNRGIGVALLSEAVKRLAAEAGRVTVETATASGEATVWKLPSELLKFVVIRDHD